MKIKLLIFSLFVGVLSWGQVSMTTTGSYNQNFDALANTGTPTWTDNTTIVNWYSQRTGSGTTYAASTGTSTAGNLYSFGAASPSTERALGTVGSGNAAAGNFAHGLLLRNTSGSTITNITVAYTGEQWRRENVAAQTITFWYRIASTTITNLTPNTNTGWTAVTALNFTSPQNSAAATALDGNLGVNRTVISSTTIPSLSLPNNQYIMIKWEDPDHAGSDHGLGIDDVQVNWTVPPSLSATALTAFGTQCVGGTYGPNSFTITGSSLTTAAIDVAALSGYEYSTTAGGTYTPSLNLAQGGGAYSQQIFVRFNPAAAISYNGNIALSGGGATAINVAASGSGLAPVTPDVTIVANPVGSICAGTSVTFTATPSNVGGGTVAYQWQINGVDVPLETNSTFTSTTLNDTENITCVITVTGGNCLTIPTDTSSSIVMTVNTCSNTLTTTATAFGPYCNTTTNAIVLPYTQSGSFSGHSDIQISDSTGVFPSDATSQLLTYVSDNGAQVTADIPVSYAAGTGYRVRVVNSSGPIYFTSGNNGSDIVINAQPIVAAIGGGAANACEGATTPVFTNATPGGTWSVVNGTGSASVTAGGVVTGITAGTVTVVYTVTNGTCSDAASIGLTVNTVPADPTGTITVSANPSCGPATLSYTTGYYWQTVSNGTSIVNPTSSDYTLNASGTIYVRAFNGSCWSTNAIDTGLITINTTPAIGTQPTAQIVTASAAAIFTVAATGSGLNYLWEVSTNGGGSWSSVGTNSNTFNTGVTNIGMNGYLYHVIVSGVSPCLAVTSNNVALTVNMPPCLSSNFPATSVPVGWGGTSANDAVAGHYQSAPNCRGIAGGNELFTSVTNYPTSIKFYVDASGSGGQTGTLWYRIGAGGWTSIGTFTATLAGATVNFNLTSTPNLSATSNISFRITSAANTIYIDDLEVSCATVWDGFAWSNGTPNLASNAIINGDYNTTANGDIHAYNLTVNPTFTTTVTPNHYVTIENNLTVNGVLNIQNNGSLVQINNSGINTGNVNMERTASVDRFDYVYWSTPVTPFVSSNISPTTSNTIYKWLPTTGGVNGFGNWTNGNETMEVGRGYIERGLNTSPLGSNIDFTATFTGVPNNGVQTMAISRGNYDLVADYSTVVSTTYATKDDDNWNLIGNPYPSSISAEQFLQDNADIAGFVKIWRHGTAPLQSAPDPFYNNYGYNYDSNDYLTYNKTGASAGSVSDYFIGAGQGFFVLMNHSAATPSTVVFNNNMRKETYRNDMFYRTANNSQNSNNEKGRIWLDISSSSASVRALVGYVDGATNEKERGYDAITDLKANMNIYSLIGFEGQIIQGRQLPFNENDQVALGVKVSQNGNYTIAIAEVDGFFTNAGQNIYLEDKLLNTIHDLRSSPYSFTANTGIYNNRFVLRYTNQTLGNDDFIAIENGVKIYASNNGINMNSELENIKHYEIYNVLGQALAAKKNLNTNESVESSILKNNQTLIVKVTLENGQRVTKKIIF